MFGLGQKCCFFSNQKVLVVFFTVQFTAFCSEQIQISLYKFLLNFRFWSSGILRCCPTSESQRASRNGFRRWTGHPLYSTDCPRWRFTNDNKVHKRYLLATLLHKMVAKSHTACELLTPSRSWTEGQQPARGAYSFPFFANTANSVGGSFFSFISFVRALHFHPGNLGLLEFRLATW